MFSGYIVSLLIVYLFSLSSYTFDIRIIHLKTNVMKNTYDIIKEVETAFNNLLNDAIKRGIIQIEELKNLIITPSSTYKLLHVFTSLNTNNYQRLNIQQAPIGSINISNCKNSIERDALVQHISEKYVPNHLYIKH